MPSAKKQRKHSTTSRVSPFVLQLLAAALQENKASLFVKVTHLRLKLLSFEIFVVLSQIEANFHYFMKKLHYSEWLKTSPFFMQCKCKVVRRMQFCCL